MGTLDTLGDASRHISQALADLKPLTSAVILLGAVTLLLPVIYAASVYGHRSRLTPPGPPTLPFIGNLHQIPSAYTHIKFTEWAQKYGGLYTLKLGSGTMAVITSRRIVKELLDKRSGVTSYRPPSYVSHDLITKGDHLLVMHYGPQWRTFRKLIHQHLMEQMVDSDHLSIVNAEAIQLVRDYVDDPKGHMKHAKRFSNSITNSIVFGIRTANSKGIYMNRLYSLMEEWSQIMETGATPPVDIFPWLKTVPEIFFSSYVSRAKSIGNQMDSLYSDILADVVKRRDDGRNLRSFLDRVLDNQGKNQLPPNQLKFIGGVLMEGGSDTSSSLILAIVQALIEYPDVQRKAQEEIDRVVGHTRSPVWSDFSSLQYINAIVKEGHRWRPILPLGFPHALGQDEIVDGKVLQKGTILIYNTWGMHMDAQEYSNPQDFDPDRYLTHKKLAPEYAAGDYNERDHYGYGTGRRICPGIHLAERNMFLSIAKLLWALRFESEPGITNDSDPVTGYHQGFLYCAKDYGCVPVVRSKKIAETLRREFEEAQRDVFSQFVAG